MSTKNSADVADVSMTLAEFESLMTERANELGYVWEYVRRDGLVEHMGAWNGTRSAVIVRRADAWEAVPPSLAYPATDAVSQLRFMAGKLLEENEVM